MITRSTTHTTLLARLANNEDATAWGEFCACYDDLIRGFARRRGLQPTDCDDVLQDVLVKLTRSMPQFRYNPTKGKFRGYLKTVVIRCMIDTSFQKHADRAVEDIEAAAEAASMEPDVEEAWEMEWRRYHLRQAMIAVATEFNARDIAAFEAYGVDGRDVNATADSLGMTADQVYQAKSRILKRVCDLIDAQVREEG